MMHDWTLKSIYFEWKLGEIKIEFLNLSSEIAILTVKGVRFLTIPKQEEWGSSVSVNEVRGPEIIEGKGKIQQLEIEMQSGDIVKIVAEIFIMP